MLFLALRILFNVAFAHLLRLSQARCRSPLRVALVNYAVGTVACLPWALVVRAPWHPLALGLGALAGLGYVVSLVLWLPAMRQAGISIVGAVVQLSLMLPVAVGIFRFGELPNRFQIAGIVLTLIALPALSASSAVGTASSARTRGAPAKKPSPFCPELLFLFLCSGGTQVVMKEFAAARPSTEVPVYSTALFAASTVCTGLWAYFRDDALPGRRGPDDRRATLGIGAAMGMSNVLQLAFLLLALAVLPGVVVFPVSASLGILMNAGVSILLWREHPRPLAWAGIAMAAAAVVLLNLK